MGRCMSSYSFLVIVVAGVPHPKLVKYNEL
jgi:hypothetical protein